mgnify:CR=1 FL=1
MIRVIVRTVNSSMACNIGGPGAPVFTSYRTFDIDVPELELFLREPANERWECIERCVVGAEILKPVLCKSEEAQ